MILWESYGSLFAPKEDRDPKLSHKILTYLLIMYDKNLGVGMTLKFSLLSGLNYCDLS